MVVQVFYFEPRPYTTSQMSGYGPAFTVFTVFRWTGVFCEPFKLPETENFALKIWLSSFKTMEAIMVAYYRKDAYNILRLLSMCYWNQQGN